MLQQRLFNLIGPLPDKVDLNPAVLEESDCGSYIRKKIEFSVEKDERIKAYLLIPKEKATPLPAIFCHHQHDGNWVLGKSEVVGLTGNSDMAYAKELAEKGFVTISIDSLGFEDRNTNPYPGIDVLNGYAHQDELIHRLISGYTLFGKALHDISTSLDYLVSLDFVDKDKLGFIGHSFGGYMALFVPAFEDRIKAAVSNCGCFTYRESLKDGYSVVNELCIPGIANVAEVDEIVSLISPRSLLISLTKDDSWSNSSSFIYEQAKKHFPEGNLQLKVFESGGHVFNKEMREHAYQFLQDKLNFSKTGEVTSIVAASKNEPMIVESSENSDTRNNSPDIPIPPPPVDSIA